MGIQSIIAGLLSTFIMVSASASAQTFVMGDTTGGPTFNRPIGNGPNLSNIGTNVAYEVTEFSVSASGAYTFNVNRLTRGFDTYLFLYQGSFDPLNQFGNFLAGNDDGGLGLNSQISIGLSTGIDYLAVVSGFNNRDFGAYELTARGPGIATITSVIPEPATWLMMIIGFAGVGLQIRRRNHKMVEVA